MVNFSFANLLYILDGLSFENGSAPLPFDHPDLTVPTSSGPVVGFVNQSYPDVRQFLGIPYAQPTTELLRFAPPQPLEKHPHHEHALFNATRTPAACPQFQPSAPSIWNIDTPQFLNPAPLSEDCLSLSIWAPTEACRYNPKEKLPVIIWLYGGGLQTGSSSIPYQQPTPWVQRSKSHVVVAIQYRLNIFGFPNAAALVDTNLGIMDQRLAMRWVRDNIASFGGDPERMILWGQSSGGASADAHAFAFRNSTMVKGFIQDSGNALIPFGGGLVTSDPSHSNFTFVASALGCPPSPPSKQLECMRLLPFQKIIDVLADYTNAGIKPPLNFIGIADNKLLFANYTDRYAKGLVSKAPTIYGSNDVEGNLQAPWPAKPDMMGPNQVIAKGVTLAAFQCPSAHSAGNSTIAGRRTYRYIYAGNFSDVSPRFWEGAYHASELPQVFGTRGEFRDSASAFEKETSEAMQDLWLAFARDPLRAEGWELAANGSMLRFGMQGSTPVEIISEEVVDWPCKAAGL